MCFIVIINFMLLLQELDITTRHDMHCLMLKAFCDNQVLCSKESVMRLNRFGVTLFDLFSAVMILCKGKHVMTYVLIITYFI